MTATFLDITMSLDGYVAGPNATLESPLGEGGDELHEWVYALASWNDAHGREGVGERTPDDEFMDASIVRTGAVVMGRRMFSGGEGPWDSDPRAMGWWGENPPFHVPVFVVTHHEREPVEMEGGTTFTFVTAGAVAAMELAREAAGDRDVKVAGGANVAQQCLAAGLLDELHVHVAPLLLGGGVPLFDAGERLEVVEARHSPLVTHLQYRVAG